MSNTSHATLLRYCRAHRPGTRPARMADATVPAAIQRIACALAGLEYEAPGAVLKFEAIIDAALEARGNG
jgi:hypothetical protein